MGICIFICICIFILYFFGHGSDGQNVSDLESGFLSAVDELAGVHSLDSEEDLFPRLVTVRVAEVYDCQWGTSTRVVDNFLDYSFNVTMSLGEIFRAEFGCSFAVFRVGLEDSTRSFTLRTNNTTHFE